MSLPPLSATATSLCSPKLYTMRENALHWDAINMLKLDGDKKIGFHVNCYSNIRKFTKCFIFKALVLCSCLNFKMLHISTSVHGEMPSAEYAKLRKESLESEFGHALDAGSKSISIVYCFGPFLALYRAAIISFHVVKLTVWQFFVLDIRKRAVKFRETLIRLGPFYIKLGQALSTRRDILATIYCQELVKLQDQIPPFPTCIAIKSIESQLGAPISKLFADISTEPVAAASLGQAYKVASPINVQQKKYMLAGNHSGNVYFVYFVASSFPAHLHSGELVAVKVQRPGMSLHFAKARKDLLVAVNEMVRHMFDEIDYIREAKNADHFASLYGSDPSDEKKAGPKATARKSLKHKDANCIKEWIDGIKLTDEIGLERAGLNRKGLIDQGLYCSLRQLLEVGFFHADPHPGNLVATSEYSKSIEK
ncbi:hypothetical protein DVH24_012743 [Malus domestica]|uniref:ABC1 atypical kinase-like domain-containing protein n=1 Tax=Malus domestica TaxID=3750 RepID=A0A498HQD8_MALDO|nr:hypothetical protein DVH24_012743 [Malus domestica]